MPTFKYSPANTKPLPLNIMDLRDEAFYDFIRQFSGKKVAELLAFQECNGVDSFLGCEDVTAVLQFKSDQLNELKKNTCITLNDGSVVLLPGLKSSIINLKKILKKKRKEINKQAERLQSINSSIRSASSTTLIAPPPTASSISQPSTYTSPPSRASVPPDPVNFSSPNTLTTSNPLTDEVKNRITRTIIDWLDKKKHELNLVNTSFQEGIDFRLELNKRRGGIIMRCKCGTKNAIGQKQGVLLFSNIYRHFKSGKCSLITENKQNLVDNDDISDNEQDQTQSTSSIPRRSNLTSVTATSSKTKSRIRSTSNISKKKRKRSN